MYGRPPPNHLSYVLGTSQVHVVDQLLRTKDDIIKLLKSNLAEAQNKMRTQANQHRREIEFAVGDQVYLRPQPYSQQSVIFRKSLNLSPHFYGPYKILSRIEASLIVWSCQLIL